MKGTQLTRLLVLGLFFSILLTACGDPTSSPIPTTTIAPTTTIQPQTTTVIPTTTQVTPILPTPTPQTIKILVDVGGYKLFLYCSGQGSPTVILDAGAGDDSSVWDKVQPEVAKSTRVCSYDRGNLGQSEKATTPRTTQQVVKELKTLLTNSQIKGPYLLVGHSFGGLNMQFFASQYPSEVVGVVLVESMHIDLYVQFDKVLTKEQSAVIEDFTGNPEKMTFDDMLESIAQVRAGAKFPPVPLIVLSKGLATPTSGWPTSLGNPFPDLDKVWSQLQAELVTLSPKGKQIIAEKSDHMIPSEQPELVVQSIEEIIKQGH